MHETSGERIQVGQLEIVFYAAKGDTAGNADVFELRVPPGAKVPGAHHHVDVDEVVFGLEGEMTYVIGDVPHRVTPGQRHFSPQGVTHRFTNRTDRMARVLIIATPARMGPEYFRDLSALVNAGGPPDMVQVHAVMRRYGLEPMPLPAAAQL